MLEAYLEGLVKYDSQSIIDAIKLCRQTLEYFPTLASYIKAIEELKKPIKKINSAELSEAEYLKLYGVTL